MIFGAFTRGVLITLAGRYLYDLKFPKTMIRVDGAAPFMKRKVVRKKPVVMDDQKAWQLEQEQNK